MKKNQLIIVGKDIPESIIAEAKAAHPDHEIIIVEDIATWKKQQATFEPLPLLITRPSLDDMNIPLLKNIDISSNNPWPEPHYSSKKRRKY